MSSFRLGALALCLALGGSAAAFGCSGGSSGGGAGGQGGEGGESAESGARGGSTSSGGKSGGRPAIPKATYQGCSGLGFVYAGGGCTAACQPVRCDCDPFPTSYTGCHPERGCLTEVDCAVACKAELGDVVSCIGKYAPCDTDQDC